MSVHYTWRESPSRLVGETVQSRMFGANILFDRDSLDLSKAGRGGAGFIDAIHELGITSLRYPGGTITEKYLNLENPDAVRQSGRDVIPLNTFMEFCGKNDISATIVIPTVRFLSEQRDRSGHRNVDASLDDVQSFVRKALRYAEKFDVKIDAFEVGNEWYHAGMSATEYGRVASAIAKVAGEAVSKDASVKDSDKPSIIVQVGYQGSAERETREIFNEFNSSELTHVSGLVTHRYLIGPYSEINGSNAYGQYFGAFETWEDLSGSAGMGRSFDRYVTEWNVMGRHEFERGLKSASSMLGLFSELVRNGVDVAHVWAVQQNNNQNMTVSGGLPWHRWDGLSINGAMFKFLQDGTVGKKLVENNKADMLDDRNERFDVEAFSGASRKDASIFVASRYSQHVEITLDVKSLISDAKYASIEIIGVARGDNPLDPDAAPYITYGASNAMSRNGIVKIELSAWEVARISITSESYRKIFNGSDLDDKITMNRHNNFSRSMSGDDTVISGAGHDRVFGGGGSDLLKGGTGNDTLHGGLGNDRILGGVGFDSIIGAFGNDYLSGGSGRDQLIGGGGRDTLRGGQGSDTLLGDAGSDALYGGNGADVLRGGQGNDTLHGGAAADVFIFDGGRDFIYDLNVEEGDRVRINSRLFEANESLNEYLSRIAILSDGEVTLRFGQGDVLRVAGEAEDVIFANIFSII